MIVHRSNQTEALVSALAEVVSEPLRDPMAPEWIVVQGRGMERWLAMQLAERFGIWANPAFLFPQGLVDGVLRGVLGRSEDAQKTFAPERMMWSIAGALPGLLGRRSFASIARYLADDDRDRMLVQLAQRIAGTFSDYLVYRPEMLLAWEDEQVGESESERWQAELWKELVRGQGGDHLAAQARELQDRLRSAPPAEGDLPQRVSVFGVSALPPLYLSLLSDASRSLETHLFVLSPSRTWFGDALSPRERKRLRRSSPQQDPEALLLDEGHPLLASLGHLGRDFQESLEEVAYTDSPADLYREASARPGSMLAVLQGDILQSRKRGAEAAQAARLPLPSDDDSIALHSCHSPMREVEVLHDALLACFEADPSLEPRDVIVMTPDIEAYSPFIEAVFEASRRDPEALGSGRGEIPHRIADRGPDATSPVAEAFRRCLDLLAGRFTAVEVSDLLGIEGVREKLDIGDDDLEPLRAWIEASGIRWGVDAAHRASLDQPERNENTWRFGIDRLLLGYARPDAGDDLFCGVLPLPGVEGRPAELLGRLLDLCERLFRYREALQEPRSPSAWRAVLVELLGELIARNDANAHEHAILCRVLAEIAEAAEGSGFEGAIELESMREQIERGLQQARRPTRFLTGGVTFCELVPMRSIPFRVVCLLGMNDEAFPRVRRPLGFDLIARSPRAGDRTTRDDDRYLFLEALLSTRERLMISYVGQSIRDGSELPPSVVVSELLDVLGESFEVPGAAGADGRAAIRRALVVGHPLQPFSPRYFAGEEAPRLFSYSNVHFEAARRGREARHPSAPFLSTALPEPEEDDDAPKSEIALEDLVAFFRDPVKRFAQRRLGLRIADEEDEIPERESAELSGLERSTVGRALTRRLLLGASREEAYESLRASGALPMGVSGRLQFDAIAREAEELVRRAHAVRGGEALPPAPIDVEIDGTRIVGQLQALWPGGQVQADYTRLGRASELAFWIRHLLLNQQLRRPGGAVEGAEESHLFGRAAAGQGIAGIQLGRVDAPEEILTELVRLYRLGQCEPLPLFETASRVYAQTLRERDSEERARVEAGKAYRGAFRTRGDREKPHVGLVFGAEEVFAPGARTASGGSAAELAERVWLPLLDRIEATS